MTTTLFDRRIPRRTLLKAGLAIGAVNLASPLASAALAAPERHGGGANRGTIKIGNIMPYSGPASAYSTIGKTEAAYFNMINDGGGINGRRIDFISYDDGYSPPKAVEQARKLVEDDNVLLIFNSLGTPSNTAIERYMNDKKYRSCSLPPARPNGTIRRTFRGPWAGNPATGAKPKSTPSTSSSIVPTARLRFSTRTTTTAWIT